jgi:hypothetical protein
MRKRRFKIPKMRSTTFRNCAWRRRSFVIKRSFVLGNKSCNGKQFFWVEEAGTGLGHCGCCTDSGGSVMNASIAYFFGGGSVKYAKIRCGSVNLVVFSSSG